MTIWRMRIACWIPKATNTHSEYVIPIAFPLQPLLHDAPHSNAIRTLTVALVHKIFTFYIKHVLTYKCPAQLQKADFNNYVYAIISGSI